MNMYSLRNFTSINSYTYKYVKISRRIALKLQTHHCAQILYYKMPYDTVQDQGQFGLH